MSKENKKSSKSADLEARRISCAGDRIALWRECLTQGTSAPQGAHSFDVQQLQMLERAWRAMREDVDYPPAFDRSEAKLAHHPLALFFLYVSYGFYPPPELLIALHEAFEAYQKEKGRLTLEEAFFGKPVQRAGTYAQRSAARGKVFSIAFETHVTAKVKKITRTAAQREVLSQYAEPKQRRKVNRK